MGVRFRKRIKLCPGINLNFSKSGMSFTVGGKGASVNFGSRGAYANVGIPGTGIYTRQKINSNRSQQRAAEKQARIEAKQQYASYVNSLEQQVVEQNNQISNLINVHRFKTTSLEDIFAGKDEMFSKQLYPKSEPKPEFSMKQGVWSAVLTCLLMTNLVGAGPALLLSLGLGYVVHKYCNNKKAKAFAESDILKNYYIDKENFEKEQERLEVEFNFNRDNLRRQYEQACVNAQNNPEANFDFFMEAIDWPRETIVSYEIVNNNLYMDVDLPEFEDMPKYNYKVVGRANEKRIDTVIKGKTEQLMDYATHIHGILFFLIKTSFKVLDNVDDIIISGYSQRMSKNTGIIEDEYLLSIYVSRLEWQQLNCNEVYKINPIEFLGNLNIKRSMTKTGIFRPIVPFK